VFQSDLEGVVQIKTLGKDRKLMRAFDTILRKLDTGGILVALVDLVVFLKDSPKIGTLEQPASSADHAAQLVF